MRSGLARFPSRFTRRNKSLSSIPTSRAKNPKLGDSLCQSASLLFFRVPAKKDGRGGKRCVCASGIYGTKRGVTRKRGCWVDPPTQSECPTVLLLLFAPINLREKKRKKAVGCFFFLRGIFLLPCFFLFPPQWSHSWRSEILLIFDDNQRLPPHVHHQEKEE